MRNSSQDSDLVFAWKVPQYWGVDVVRVVPSSGLLKPGESKACKVTFCPKFLPRVYDLEVFCEMTNKTLLVSTLRASSMRFTNGKILG